MGVKLKVNYEVFTHNLGGYDPEDSWSRDSTSADVTVEGLEIVEGYFDTICQDDIKNGDKVGLLWVEYTTGDSFGRDGGKTEFVQVLPLGKLDILEKNAKKIRENEHADGFNVNLLDAYGEKYIQHCPWKGYFEQINSINVDILDVGGSRKF